jgi:hypothetical protein
MLASRKRARQIDTRDRANCYSSAFQNLNPVPTSLLVFGLPPLPPVEVVQLFKIGYATIY